MKYFSLYDYCYLAHYVLSIFKHEQYVLEY